MIQLNNQIEALAEKVTEKIRINADLEVQLERVRDDVVMQRGQMEGQILQKARENGDLESQLVEVRGILQERENEFQISKLSNDQL